MSDSTNEWLHQLVTPPTSDSTNEWHHKWATPHQWATPRNSYSNRKITSSTRREIHHFFQTPTPSLADNKQPKSVFNLPRKQRGATNVTVIIIFSKYTRQFFSTHCRHVSNLSFDICFLCTTMLDNYYFVSCRVTDRSQFLQCLNTNLQWHGKSRNDKVME